MASEQPPTAARSGDGHWENWLVEVLPGNSLRDLRLALLAMAFRLSQKSALTLMGMVVLPNNRISLSTLEHERARMDAVLQPDLLKRMLVFKGSAGLRSFLGRSDTPDALRNPDFWAYLENLIRNETKRMRPYGSAPGGGKDAVLECLILSWLNKEGPLSALEMQRRAGVSYPTVAAVVKDLEASGVLGRGFKRSAGLKRFPWAEWRNWLARTATSRKTMLYHSTAESPCSAQEMLERLVCQGRNDVAIGGTLGAARHYSRLDVAGTPRLDLVVLGEPADFTQLDAARLDPSLKSGLGHSAKATLAVHFAGRRKTPHLLREGSALYADVVNCLVDLHELGLEAQANEMLRTLVDARSATL